MGIVTSATARAFIKDARLPRLPARTRAALERNEPPLELKDKDAQALVVGSGLIAAAKDVPQQVRADLVDCTLFAQLAAGGAVTDPSNVAEWYREYFNALTALGWAQSQTNFREFRRKGKSLETHQSIIKVLALMLGPQAAAVTLVTETLNALQTINANSPWITLFDRESISERAAKFQVATAQYSDTDTLEIALVAFELHAKSTLTQVLFFKTESTAIKLKYADGRATIYEAALAANRADVADRLKEYRSSYVKEVKFPPPKAPAKTAASTRTRGKKNRAADSLART